MVFCVGLLIISYLTATAAHGSVGQDVVLSCLLVEEGGDSKAAGARDSGGNGGRLSKTPATLVLRDLPMSPDLSPETVTPYVAPENPNPDDVIIEAIVTSPEIPEADSLLHADCNEQEVACEISRYVPRGFTENAEEAFFIGTVSLEGGGVSFSLVLRTLPPTGGEPVAPPLLQSKLKLPLTPSGTILTKVAFVVYTRSQSITAPLGGDTLLDCGFKQQDPFPVQDMWLEWRLQNRGFGWRVMEMATVDPGEPPMMRVVRNESSVDQALAVDEGNVSLTLRKLRVFDEGMYICSVGSGPYQGQQVVLLQLTKPPNVSLSVHTVTFKNELTQKLSCHSNHYYPLDVEVEWLYLPPSVKEPISLTENSTLTSHRQYYDKTYSLSSHLTLYPAALPAGTVVTCLVSHRSLAEPVAVSLTVLAAERENTSNWMIVGLVAATALFLYIVLQ